MARRNEEFNYYDNSNNGRYYGNGGNFNYTNFGGFAELFKDNQFGAGAYRGGSPENYFPGFGYRQPRGSNPLDQTQKYNLDNPKYNRGGLFGLGEAQSKEDNIAELTRKRDAIKDVPQNAKAKKRFDDEIAKIRNMSNDEYLQLYSPSVTAGGGMGGDPFYYSNGGGRKDRGRQPNPFIYEDNMPRIDKGGGKGQDRIPAKGGGFPVYAGGPGGYQVRNPDGSISFKGGENPGGYIPPSGSNAPGYGSRIGDNGPGTSDFKDSDGDGVDDRYQTGPGKPEGGGNNGGGGTNQPAPPENNSGGMNRREGNQGDGVSNQMQNGYVGFSDIMKQFFNWSPSANNDEGRALKYALQTDWLSKFYDSNLSKSMGQYQAGLSKEMMTHQFNLEQMGQSNSRKEEFGYGMRAMDKQYELQNLFANQQYGRDLGTLAATGEQGRKTIRAQGVENRLQTVTEGEQERLGIAAEGDQTRKTYDFKDTIDARKENRQRGRAKALARSF